MHEKLVDKEKVSEIVAHIVGYREGDSEDRTYLDDNKLMLLLLLVDDNQRYFLSIGSELSEQEIIIASALKLVCDDVFQTGIQALHFEGDYIEAVQDRYKVIKERTWEFINQSCFLDKVAEICCVVY